MVDMITKIMEKLEHMVTLRSLRARLFVIILAVGITRYVSLGSILVVCSYLIQAIIFGQLGYLHIEGATLSEFYVVSACFTAMALWRHRANIKRLLTGTENKFGMKKEK